MCRGSVGYTTYRDSFGGCRLMSVEGRADSKRAGERVERHIIDSLDHVVAVPDERAHHDARAETMLSPSHELPFASICVVEADTPIEIKSAMVVISSGSRKGRFYFREQQHEWLLEHGGVYCVVVCEPTPQRDILARKLIRAPIINELTNSWCRPEGRAAYDQLAWSRLFDEREIGGGA